MTGPPQTGVKAPIVNVLNIQSERDWLNTALALAVGFIVWRLVLAAVTKFYARRFVSRFIPRVSTYSSLTKSLVGAVILVAVILELLNIWRINVVPALYSAGVLGIVIGFGAQAIVRDMLTGAFYLFEDTFDVGDTVELTTTNGVLHGVVETVSLREVRIVDERGYLNSIPYGSIVFAANATRLPLRMNLDFDVPLHDDIGSLRGQISAIATKAVNASHVDVDGLEVTLNNVTAATASFRVTFQVSRQQARVAASQLRELIAKDMQAAGFLPSKPDQPIASEPAVPT